MADQTATAIANQEIAAQADEWFFRTDQVRIYTVSPFKEAGFGVPSFGTRVFTANRPLYSLASEIGKTQLVVMCDVDARRMGYPSMNTIQRIGKALNRAFSVLLGREKSSEELRLDGGKGSPMPLPWLMHPVPYFNGDFVRNAWLSQYNELTMFALANLMQHNDNELALTITTECAQQVLNYFQEIKFLLGGELLGISRETLAPREFQFNEAAYAGYADIAQRTMSFENIDSGVDARAGFTEWDLRPLLQGIPSNLILPNLGLYPIGPHDSYSEPTGNLGIDDVAAQATQAPGEAIKPVV